MKNVLPLLSGTVAWSSLVLLTGCSSPCDEYCEVFVERAQECGLGGPSGDSAVDECGEEVGEVIEDDACEDARDRVSGMGCAELTELVCSQRNAELTYNCPPG